MFQVSVMQFRFKRVICPQANRFQRSFHNIGSIRATFETIQIVLNKLFPNSDSIFLGFNKKLFSKVLQLCTKDNLFLLNSETFFQIDGAPMGGCDIFVCFHEKVWLNICPSEFKSVFYRRYVDDTFLLFRFPSHIQLFLTNLNSQHQSIEFTFHFWILQLTNVVMIFY